MRAALTSSSEGKPRRNSGNRGKSSPWSSPRRGWRSNVLRSRNPHKKIFKFKSNRNSVQKSTFANEKFWTRSFDICYLFYVWHGAFFFATHLPFSLVGFLTVTTVLGLLRMILDGGMSLSEGVYILTKKSHFSTHKWDPYLAIYENAAECPVLCLPAGRQGRG